jgi:hypothetical protein
MQFFRNLESFQPHLSDDCCCLEQECITSVNVIYRFSLGLANISLTPKFFIVVS